MTASLMRRASATGLVVLLAACGGGSSPTTPTPPPPPPAVVNTGVLNVTISGVPSGTNASVTVTGPGGFSRVLTATTALTALAPGAYTATSANVTGGDGTVYTAPGPQNATVANGTTATITATYTAQPIVPQPSGQDLAIAAMYITQGTQRLDGTIPLVQDRDAWLRVFVRGGNFSTPSAPVRVRLYQGGNLVQTITIPAPSSFVPTNVDEGSPGTSWNIAIPGSRIQPGLSILADVDPNNTVTETSEANNNFPSTGTPLALPIRTVPAMNVRFVPVQTRSGLGGVSTDNVQSFLTFTRAVWPVATVNAEVRPIFTAADTAVFQDGGSWSRVLGELRALRTAESSSAYYVGVVFVSYNSGIAGIGYVPSTPQQAATVQATLVWDKVNSRASVTAHELGHNFGRPHAPCGSTDRPDPDYPYSDGSIGIFGVDVARANSSPSGLAATGVIKPPTFTDLMGYCSNEWVSDFHYERVLDWRTAGVPTVVMAPEPMQDVMIVWGRSSATGITLEPAFAVTARPSRPSGTGSHLVEVRDEAGTVVYSNRFTPDALDHGEAGESHFNFALPMSAATAARLGSIRVSSNGRIAEMRRTPAAVAVEARIAGGTEQRTAVALRTVVGARGGREARWDAAAYPFAVVRNARTGQITGFSRTGAAALTGTETELTLSDGVRSRVVRVAP